MPSGSPVDDEEVALLFIAPIPVGLDYTTVDAAKRERSALELKRQLTKRATLSPWVRPTLFLPFRPSSRALKN